MQLSIALILALALVLLGQCLSRHAARRHQLRLRRLHSATLQRSLELLQTLQQHRGLGAQQDIASTSQRNALARRIDQLWLNWPGPSLQLPPLQQDWPQLRRKPADFAAHCQMIEALLGVIEQLEDRLCLETDPPLRGLGQACRVLEDLARLRGLAMRAANYRRCPGGLQVQLRSLCQRLAEPGHGEPLHGLLRRLERELIEAPQARLSPSDCFALLTPLIDAGWRDLPGR
ncbi:hypothetical protein I0D00_06065 [Pseudomonas lalucatii]|uniref:Nitrate/nitrite sensing protein domain-containing protein n=1 Tax=Pseudomonas lalucatii TaxID=1424203 RepID=A0ABS5PZJ8_9PSED|nr:hypothetical protein [Pseudomonas lalucatii]MBS7661516.1 hypothetical protein [Pseudomonas lalucatii]MBS7691850.1 hypothetical protein [Pseudomonas lalucatii]QVM87957.1 hypothetical protein I0D68_03070 [Pseudomonas lalucatii]